MLVGRAGLSPVMVGRSAELDRLARLLETDGSAPVIALVGGEAGVGKTRLVRELVAAVRDRVPVLAGQADPGGLARPFQLLIDALDGAVDADGRRLDPDRVVALADRAVPLEQRLDLGLDLVGEVVDGRDRAAGRRRALVAFEDLHWADSESLLVLERLAARDAATGARRGPRPVALVGTYRPDAVHRRHPLAEFLTRLERRHEVTGLRLGRLGPADVGAFLAAVYDRSPSYRVVEALHARTGGNPFFLEELLACCVDDDSDPGALDGLAEEPLPWSLAEAVRTQLDDLDPEERRIVEAAAVLGGRSHFDLLATVTGATEDRLIGLLRGLVDRRLLVEVESDVFGFRHALAREAIESDLLGRERRRLHRSAFEALQAGGHRDLAQAAHHAAGAGLVDELLAAARDGAEEYLAQGSTYQALQLAELGLTVADEDPTLLAAAARAAWLAGLVGDALAHVEQLLAVLEDPARAIERSGALRLLARLAWEAGDEARVQAVTDELAALAVSLPPSGERGRAMAQVAQTHMFADDVEQALVWAERALDEAATIGDDGVRASALVEKGSTLMMTADRRDEGAVILSEAVTLGEQLGDLVVVARALHNLVRCDHRPDDLAAARAMLDRMKVAAERAGFDSMAGVGHAQGMADLAEWEGDFDAAMEALAEGRRVDRGYLRTAKGTWFGVHQAGLALEAGEVVTAAALAAKLGRLSAVDLSPHRVEEHMTGRGAERWATGLHVHVALATGDLPAARAGLAALVAEGGNAPLAGYVVHDIVSAALRARLGPDELRPLVERIGSGIPSEAATSDLTRALVTAQLDEADGRPSDALAGYGNVLAAGEADCYPSVRGTAHVGAARCLLALGRAPEAVAHVEAAEGHLARWRGWRVADLDAVRRRLGRGPAPEGPAVLTPREREVVALVAEGLSNAQLAERLFIARKTAAVHVSNVLAKLDMSSRTEVAAWAVRHGLGPST